MRAVSAAYSIHAFIFPLLLFPFFRDDQARSFNWKKRLLFFRARDFIYNVNFIHVWKHRQP